MVPIIFSLSADAYLASRAGSSVLTAKTLFHLHHHHHHLSMDETVHGPVHVGTAVGLCSPESGSLSLDRPYMDKFVSTRPGHPHRRSLCSSLHEPTQQTRPQAEDKDNGGQLAKRILDERAFLQLGTVLGAERVGCNALDWILMGGNTGAVERWNQGFSFESCHPGLVLIISHQLQLLLTPLLSPPPPPPPLPLSSPFPLGPHHPRLLALPIPLENRLITKHSHPPRGRCQVSPL